MFRVVSVRVRNSGSDGGSHVELYPSFVITIAHPANMDGITRYINHYFMNNFPTVEYVGVNGTPNIIMPLNNVCDKV